MSVLAVENLSKTYGRIKALQEVSFKVPKGTVFGILGPNGSGKTTLLGIVMDVLRATSGDFFWNGVKGTPALRREIGTLLETPNFYHYLSGQQNLAIAAEIKGKGKDNIEDALRVVNLYERRHSKFSSYSLGMKQRLAIASALLADPEILVFDEPTNGLDPAGIAEIREVILNLHQKGKTIIMASHILDEVEKVCTHVAIIQKGVLKTTGTVNDVLSVNRTQHTTIEAAAADNALLHTTLKNLAGIEKIVVQEDGLVITTENLTPGKLNEFCFANGVVLNKLNVKRVSLESRFLEITGNKSDH